MMLAFLAVCHRVPYISTMIKTSVILINGIVIFYSSLRENSLFAITYPVLLSSMRHTDTYIGGTKLGVVGGAHRVSQWAAPLQLEVTGPAQGPPETRLFRGPQSQAQRLNSRSHTLPQSNIHIFYIFVIVSWSVFHNKVISSGISVMKVSEANLK